MTATTTPSLMSSTQPHPTGSSSGWALDVIVVAPSSTKSNTDNNGVAASSDFYVSFPSSLAKSRMNSITSTTKRLTSFVSKKSITNNMNMSERSSREEGTISGSRTSSSMSTQLNNSSSATYIPNGNVQVRINGRYISKLDMTFSKNKTSSSCCRFVHGNGLRPSIETLKMLIEGTDSNSESEVITCTCSEALRNCENHLCAKRIEISGEGQSNEPILTFGRNLIKYTLVSEKGVAIASTEAHLYLWSALDSVIVSDIDGTITKDNVGGVVDTVVQEKYAHIHNGICKFFEDLSAISPVEDMDALNSSGDGEGEIRFMYLSSRPISIVNYTRKLLKSVSQIGDAKEKRKLPPGPMMCNVVPLTSVLYSELVSKNVHEFKSDVLSRQVLLPFVAARGENLAKTKMVKSSRTIRTSSVLDEIDENEHQRSFSDGFKQPPKDDRLFLAGFGNTLRDAIAYEMAGMDRDDIYIIDTKSRIMCMGERSQSEKFDDSNHLGEIPNNNSISDFIVDGVCCLGSGEEDRVIPGNEAKRGKSQDSSACAVFDEQEREPSREDWGELQRRSNKKSVKVGNSVSQSIRAFTTKKSLTKFPSFASSVSSKSSKSSSKKMMYSGYDDPSLLEAVRKRIQGDQD